MQVRCRAGSRHRHAAQLPFFVVDSDGGEEVEPVSACLRDLMLGEASPLTCRSNAFDLLRLLACPARNTRPRLGVSHRAGRLSRGGYPSGGRPSIDLIVSALVEADAAMQSWLICEMAVAAA